MDFSNVIEKRFFVSNADVTQPLKQLVYYMKKVILNSQPFLFVVDTNLASIYSVTVYFRFWAQVLQVFKCSSVQVFKCSSVQVFKCSSVRSQDDCDKNKREETCSPGVDNCVTISMVQTNKVTDRYCSTRSNCLSSRAVAQFICNEAGGKCSRVECCDSDLCNSRGM